MSRTISIAMMVAFFCLVASMATDYKCCGITLRLLGKVLRMYRSLMDVPSSTSPARSRMISKQEGVPRSQIWK